MTRRPSHLAALVLLIPGLALAQSSTSTFVAADVHTSPKVNQPFVRATGLVGTRYTMRGATMVDLIAAAYGVDASNVQGGPNWLLRDRFEVFAKAPDATTKDATKPMLQALLADRFKLVTHTGSKPLPAYVLSVGKGGSKLKPAADDSIPGKCEFTGTPPAPGAPFTIVFTCKNMQMEDFAHNLGQWGQDYMSSPVVDATGLKGGFDFDFKWNPKSDLTKAGPDGITIFSAVEKELGLKLDLLTAPRPVIIVDSVNETPSPNAPGLEAILPPIPAPEFEVATVKPSKPDQTLMGRIQGTQVNLQGVTLKFLISFAWDLNPNDNDVPVNSPKWLSEDKFDILAKLTSTAKGEDIDPEDLRRALRLLITERFQMKSHMEDVPMNGYQLVAASPKLKKADPTNYTTCKEGPGPDGKDPRTANPVLNRLLTCQNITMDQIAEELQRVAGGYIYGPVLNATGIEGSYDFTLSFSSADKVKGGGPASADGTTPSDPNGAVSLYDAVSKQLGLKLEKQKRPMHVLVIDHIEQKPTVD